MADISQELVETLSNSFREKFSENENIKRLNELLLDKKAYYKEANQYAIELGDLLSNVYKENISADILPDGKMNYNLGKKIIDPTMRDNYDLVSAYCQEVQEIINKESGININALQADINEDRINGIVNKLASDDFEKVDWVLDESIKNFTQSIVDSTIKKNAEFHAKSGLNPKIKRIENGNCCDWCKKLVGVYKYPEDIPDEVYRRHRYCRCTVEYLPGDGRRQDVHSKVWKGKIKVKPEAITAQSSAINIVKEVAKGNINLKSNKEHYEKHIKGTKRYYDYLEARRKKELGQQSRLTISEEEVQRLINNNYGRGIVTVTKNGEPRKEELVNFNKKIGYNVYKDKEYPTKKGKIIYSKKGSHIVPIEGDDFD